MNGQALLQLKAEEPGQVSAPFMDRNECGSCGRQSKAFGKGCVGGLRRRLEMAFGRCVFDIGLGLAWPYNAQSVA